MDNLRERITALMLVRSESSRFENYTKVATEGECVTRAIPDSYEEYLKPEYSVIYQPAAGACQDMSESHAVRAEFFSGL